MLGHISEHSAHRANLIAKVAAPDKSVAHHKNKRNEAHNHSRHSPESKLQPMPGYFVCSENGAYIAKHIEWLHGKSHSSEAQHEADDINEKNVYAHAGGRLIAKLTRKAGNAAAQPDGEILKSAERADNRAVYSAPNESDDKPNKSHANSLAKHHRSNIETHHAMNHRAVANTKEEEDGSGEKKQCEHNSDNPERFLHGLTGGERWEESIFNMLDRVILWCTSKGNYVETI